VRARDNPFASHRVEAVGYRFQDGTSWPALLARCAELGYRGALVGPEGAGKTTLLEELARRLAGRGFGIRWLTLRRGQRRLPAGEEERLLSGLGPRDLLVVDGADQLAALPWRRLREASRAAAGLLIAVHREGRLPTLHRCATSPALLAAIAGELLGPGEHLPHPAEELFARHRGNLRAALRELYDVFAER
jgi:hypothetical protein